MRRTRSLVFACAALVASASPAWAQHITSPYRFIDRNQEVTLFGGYLASSQGTVGLGVESAPIFGGRYDLRVSGPFNLDAGFSLVPTTRGIVDSLRVASDSVAFQEVGTGDVTLAVVDAGIRFDLTGPRTWHRLQPYLLGGAAVVVRARTDEAADSAVASNFRYRPGTRFAVQVGAGIEWIPTPGIGIRLDARDYLWRVKTPTGFLVYSLTVPDKEWLQHYAVSLGLGIRF